MTDSELLQTLQPLEAELHQEVTRLHQGTFTDSFSQGAA